MKKEIEQQIKKLKLDKDKRYILLLKHPKTSSLEAWESVLHNKGWNDIILGSFREDGEIKLLELKRKD